MYWRYVNSQAEKVSSGLWASYWTGHTGCKARKRRGRRTGRRTMTTFLWFQRYDQNPEVIFNEPEVGNALCPPSAQLCTCYKHHFPTFERIHKDWLVVTDIVKGNKASQDVRGKHCTWLDPREALLPWDNKSERCHPWLRRRKIPSEASPRLPIMVTHSPKHCIGVKQYSVTKTTPIITLRERLLKIVDQLHEGAAPPIGQAL